MREFTALSDPTRRKIVEILTKGERTAGELAERFHVSGPCVSQHLKVLKEAKLVSVRADAQRRVYQLNREGFDELSKWIERVRGFWNDRLDALERELSKQKEKGR